MHPSLWHLRAESHYILEGPFHPNEVNRTSNRCTAEDADDDTVEISRRRFYEEAINVSLIFGNPDWFFHADGFVGRLLNAAAIKSLGYASKIKKPGAIRFLEKTPKNSLRVSLRSSPVFCAKVRCVRFS